MVHFGPDYLEPFTLRDGRPARFVALRPEHATIVTEGFAKLSDRSRYMRYFGPKRVLTETDLHRLLTQDGDERYAIAVVTDGEAGTEGMALGRLARSEQDPRTAEIAITVVDAYQRLGLGRLLLDRLQAAAADHGYVRVRGEVLAENRPMLALLRKAIPNLRTKLDGIVVTVEWELPAFAERAENVATAA